jgi:hypothetical protein
VRAVSLLLRFRNIDHAVGSGFRRVHCGNNLIHSSLDQRPTVLTQYRYCQSAPSQILLMRKIRIGREQQIKTGLLSDT